MILGLLISYYSRGSLIAGFFTLLRVHNLKKFDNTGEDLEDLISIGTIYHEFYKAKR
ncbi:hypothetical protein [Paenibacillus alba]|uniref:hypothetical protein n=1 Tax=Paenibacillus alba TaxID=1197127 RepID=UPI001FEBEB29|nr:hypothetical protein [Paenibacillus alba]